MKNIKRIVAILMALAITCMFTTSVFAANAEVVSDETIATAENVEARAPGKILASGTTTIYNGDGILSIYLPSGNFFADIQAGIGYSPYSGIVTCTVRTPDGEVIRLNSMMGTGSKTNTVELSYAPAGNYLFYFGCASPEPFEVVAFIYD